MLYLFCSAASPLYKRDALECISYPSGHIFRFRYALKYVQPEILKSLKCYVDKRALLVFLDTVGAEKTVDFKFYPLRVVSILRMEVVAGAIYIDFRFGDFVNYLTDNVRRDAWHQFFANLAIRPWPLGARTGANPDGRFVLIDDAEPPELSTSCAQPFDNWNSVVKQLDKTKDLADSTFVLIQGFFIVDGKLSEKNVKATTQGLDSIYPVPMGQTVVLKTLLSRPSFNLGDPKSARALTISTTGDVFAGISKDKIHSESRYNEDRTVLVCKRVFDTVLAIVTIEEKENENNRSPRLRLLTRVRVPRLIVSTVVTGVAVSALLLAMDSEVVTFLSTFMPPSMEKWFCANAKAIASVAKLLASVPVAISAYVAFRKLPIK